MNFQWGFITPLPRLDVSMKNLGNKLRPTGNKDTPGKNRNAVQDRSYWPRSTNITQRILARRRT